MGKTKVSADHIQSLEHQLAAVAVSLGALTMKAYFDMGF